VMWFCSTFAVRAAVAEATQVEAARHKSIVCARLLEWTVAVRWKASVEILYCRCMMGLCRDWALALLRNKW
jgi:hypothetical protein